MKEIIFMYSFNCVMSINDILQIILLTVGTMLDKSDYTFVTLYRTTLKL